HPAPRDVARHVRPHDVTGAAGILRREGVVDRAIGIAAPLVPGAGALVQPRLALGLPVSQLAPQSLAQERVVPVPLVVAVERDEQQVRPRHLTENTRRAGALEDRVAHFDPYPVEYRGPREVADLLVR